MQYDFDTYIDRRGSGSIKWELACKNGRSLPEGIVPFSIADMEFKNPPEVTAAMKVNYFADESIIEEWDRWIHQ